MARPRFEHADHAAIRNIRENDKAAARIQIKTAERTLVIRNNGGDQTIPVNTDIVRILTDSLTTGESLIRRRKAGLIDNNKSSPQTDTKKGTISLQSGGGPHVISETWQNESLVTPGNTEIDIHKLANESSQRVEINGTLYTLKEMIDLISIFGKPELDQIGGSFWFDVERAIQVKSGSHWYGQSAMGKTPFEAVAQFFRIVSSGNEVRAGTGPIYIWDNEQKVFNKVCTED